VDERTRLVTVTSGMLKAMGKTRMSDRTCEGCKLGFPIYPGRYPTKCPRCGGAVARAVSEDRLPGGKADTRRPSDFDPAELRLGVKHELEHTKDAAIALEIAMDHLVDDPHYYSKMAAGVLPKEAGGAVASVPFDIRPSESAGPMPPLPVVLASSVPRLQTLIDEGDPGEPRDATTSRLRSIAFDKVERLLPAGIEGLRMFLEGPAPTNPPRYYRLEGIDDPVIVVEFDASARHVHVFATLDPVTYLGSDPRADLVAEAVALEETDRDKPGGPIIPRDTSVIVEKPDGAGGRINGRPKTLGTPATRPVGGFRFEIGYNKRRHPRRNVELSIQNRLNARRGLASRVRAAKDWHRSHAGRSMHRDLARYNRTRAESLGLEFSTERGRIFWDHVLPRALALAEDSAVLPDERTIDDIFDSLLRRLIAIESTDILQDVEFSDDGAIYLFFDPVLTLKEVDEVMQALSQEAEQLQLVASPDKSIPGEEVESDWWVIYVPPAGGRQPGVPDPTKYAAVPPPPGAKAPKGMMVTMAPPTGVEQIAMSIDVDKLIGAVGKPAKSSSPSPSPPPGDSAFTSGGPPASEPMEGRVMPLWVPAGGREYHLRESGDVFGLLEAALAGKGRLFLVRECSYDAAVETVGRGRLRPEAPNVWSNLDDVRDFLGKLRTGGR
jgi:hypothetical protein